MIDGLVGLVVFVLLFVGWKLNTTFYAIKRRWAKTD